MILPPTSNPWQYILVYKNSKCVMINSFCLFNFRIGKKIFGLLLVLEKAWAVYNSQIVDDKDLEDLPDLKTVDRYIEVAQFHLSILLLQR